MRVGPGFDKLELDGETSDPKSKEYALLLSDTVVVGATADAPPEVMTKPAQLEVKDVVWETREDGEASDSEDDDDRGAQELLNKVEREGNKRDKLVDGAKDTRKLNQVEIARRNKEQAIARLRKLDAENEAKNKKMKTPVAYESTTRYPRLKRPHQIHVDQSSDAVFLPVFGQPVPVHVAMIKNISRQTDPGGRYVEMRINLETPGLTAASARNKCDPQPA